MSEPSARSDRRDRGEKRKRRNRSAGTLVDPDPATLVDVNTGPVSEGAINSGGEGTLLPAGPSSQASGTLASGEDGTLISEVSDTMLSDSRVMVFIRGDGERLCASALNAAFGNITYWQGSNTQILERANASGRHLLVVDSSMATDLNASTIRSIIYRLLDDMEHTDIDLVTLHRDGDQCQKLRASAIAGVSIGTSPKFIGAYLVHSKSYNRVNLDNLNACKIACRNDNIFNRSAMIPNEDCNSCIPIMSNSDSNWYGWLIGAGILLILIILIILAVSRKRSA